MSDPHTSPISQLLHTLGLTREDLGKRSDQMRQFLTTEGANSLRVAERDNTYHPSFPSELRSISKSTTSTTSLSRSRSRTNSYSFKDTTPPITPIKSEFSEGSVPHRQFDSMEMVIERQRRQNRKDKKERRERERELGSRTSALQPPSPSPNSTSQNGLNLDIFMHSRDGQRGFSTEANEIVQSTSASAVTPVTPQRSKYYRDHTNLSANHSQSRVEEPPALKTEPPTPTHASSRPQPTHPQYHAYTQYFPYAQLLPSLPFGNPQASSSVDPETPQHQRKYTLHQVANSPLPPSSPPPASSPISSPNRRIVNLVSSPGPMGPLPDEEEYDNLPYTLPPGPYSPNKPDASYAALVGQAILSSPEHRLTLQEIYDWITIVYPHFKRGEQTWMNSIRHVLSTTVCFRKIPRERAVGRTQWAIFDEDLECFKGGGFRKQLCKDMVNGAASKDKQAGSKAKKGRKRAGVDDSMTDSRKAKKSKKDLSATLLTGPIASSYLPATISSHPLFPPSRPTPHHQPYYESCLPQPQPLPADIIFPPLPQGVGYTRYSSKMPLPIPTPSPTLADPQKEKDNTYDEVTPIPSERKPRSAPSSGVSSIPGLTPNRSSSSTPPATSEMDHSMTTLDPETNTTPPDVNTSVVISALSEELKPSVDDDDEDNSLPVPIQFLGGSPKAVNSSLQPGIRLSLSNDASEEEDGNDKLLLKRSKIAKKHEKSKSKKRMSFPPIPSSPTLNRRTVPSKASRTAKDSTSLKLHPTRSTTPPPSTPPRSTRQLPTSSVRTPLAEKDLSINPAVLRIDADDSHDDCAEFDMNRTPRKRLSDSGLTGPAPVTPRKLVFPTNQNDSPFRTPGYIFGTSPFRTPGSRAVFDPHDPGALLDEELSRMGAAGHGDSPAGLFGKERGSLLYDSPGLHSPGQWHKWW